MPGGGLGREPEPWSGPHKAPTVESEPGVEDDPQDQGVAAGGDPEEVAPIGQEMPIPKKEVLPRVWPEDPGGKMPLSLQRAREGTSRRAVRRHRTATGTNGTFGTARLLRGDEARPRDFQRGNGRISTAEAALKGGSGVELSDIQFLYRVLYF